jgi:outer membrane protein OmpA-like peptidoglycan-associated protein
VKRVESLGTISYQVDFHLGTAVMKDEGPSVLSRVADTMHYYPSDEILLAARSPSADADDLALAERRLAAARTLLVDRGLRPERIETQVRFGAGSAATVDIFILEAP